MRPGYPPVRKSLGQHFLADGKVLQRIADAAAIVSTDTVVEIGPGRGVLTVPAEAAQAVLDRVVKTGVKAVLNFAPTQLQAPADVTVKTVNMAMELEGFSFALTNRD